MNIIAHLGVYICLASLAMFSSCKQDELFEDDCLDPAYRVDLNVHVAVDNTMEHFMDVDSVRYVDPNIVNGTKSEVRAGDWAVRYYVAAYRRDESEPFAIESSMRNPVKLSLRPDKYKLVGWADHVPEDNGKSHHFYTSDFSDILLRHKYDYKANDMTKIAYHGQQDVRVGYTTSKANLNLTTAVGRYRLEATDKPDYKVGKILVKYKNLPASFHALYGTLNHGWGDVEYTSMPMDNLLAFDHVVAPVGKSVVVNICVEIFDEEGNLRNRARDIGIPIKNGGITTVKGNFYSILDLDNNESAGGITIDTEFDETIEIEV